MRRPSCSYSPNNRAGLCVPARGPCSKRRWLHTVPAPLPRSAQARDEVVLNLDVGGGTAKLAIVKNGNVLETAAINVGARLITLDKEDRVTKVERAAEIVARHHDLPVALGRHVSDEVKTALAKALAVSLLETASRHKQSDLTKQLMITEPLRHTGTVHAAYFSGGVSEYLYETEAQSFGDLGVLLGQQIRELIPNYLSGVSIEAPLQRIRATVIGASQFTAQVSGNTIYVNNPELLPLRNLQVVTVRMNDADLTATGIAAVIENAFLSAEVVDGEDNIAIAVHWPHGPAYQQLRALCEGIARACENTVRNRQSLIVILDCDVARLVGANLSEVLDGYKDIICIDGVQLQDFDYIDISEEHEQAGVVTVVIKSLVFSG